MTRRFPASRSPLRAAIAVGVIATGVACGEETPSEYSAQNTDDFFAACTDATIDSVLHTRLCQCVIDELTTELDFEEFVELDEAMAAEPARPTASAIVDVVADCVIEVGDL